MNDDFDDLDMRNVQKMHIPLVTLPLMTAKSLPQQKGDCGCFDCEYIGVGGVMAFSFFK